VQKLSQKQKLSADEYRSLGVGTTGVESWHSFQWSHGGFNTTGTVNVVYADSPAQKAGIRLGDKITYGDRDPAIEAKQRANPYLTRVQVTFAPVGAPLDVTIERHKQPPVKITLIRMNIEDIKEPSIRREWERMVRNLGYPKGTFTGSSDSHLER
jgi:C-terminal processing protease CtpA/Prc